MVKITTAVLLVVTWFFTTAATSDTPRQTSPDCKKVFPDFQHIDDLNKKPGTLTEGEVIERIVRLDTEADEIGDLTNAQVDNAKSVLVSTRDTSEKLRTDVQQLTEERELLERLVGNYVELMRLSPEQSGSLSEAYCRYASKLATVTYQLQQDNYNLQITSRVLRNAERVVTK